MRHILTNIPHVRPQLVLFCFLLVNLFSPISSSGKNAGESLPNIIFLLADDIGWADPGRYHEHYSGNKAKVPTPNLDKLCDQGNNNCGCNWDGGDCCG